MRLVTFYTPTHKVYYENYFLKTINQYEFLGIHAFVYDQIGESGLISEKGFGKTMIKKAESILEVCRKTHLNEFILYADVDMVFLGDIKEYLIAGMKDNDIVFQDNYTNICAGFFMFYNNGKLWKFFEEIAAGIKTEENDQPTYWRILESRPDIKYGVFDKRVYNIAFSTEGKIWKGNEEVVIPDDCLVFHANWTIGEQNKIKLLNIALNKRK